MFDASQLSMMFAMDCASGTDSPVVSLSIYGVGAHASEADQSQKEIAKSANAPTDVLLSLTKDARLTVIDSTTGLIINSYLLDQKQSSTVSMYVIGKCLLFHYANFLSPLEQHIILLCFGCRCSFR